jgi:hypothetical protein
VIAEELHSMRVSDERANSEFSLAAVKAASRWLSAHAHNVNSQAGEDGIVEKALSLLPDLSHWCVEFGAWDGRYMSNTFNQVDHHGSNVVLIEGDQRKYRELCSSYPHADRAVFIHSYVGWSADNNLDRLLAPHPVPESPDLLSIDVDGNDYHIWQATTRLRPKLVLIEYNPTMANCLDFVQPADAGCNQGNSPAALVRLGKEKNYELIAATRLNLLFVDRRYYSLFRIPDNSLEAMRDDPPDHLFCGYDGTVFVHGAVGARWHRLWLSKANVQVLPLFLRRYPPTYSHLQKTILNLWRWFRDPSSQRVPAEPNHIAEERRRRNSQPQGR